MKNLYFLIALAISTTAISQVPNPSFEEFTGYGNETRFWGPHPMFITVSIPIDGGPSVATPIITYEDGASSYCFFNNDARNGNRAMEIRNAYNETDAVVVPGKMILFNEDQGSTTASGWNTGFHLTPDVVIEGLGFYYKFLPVGNDVAQAKMELFNEAHEVIGSTVLNLSGTHSEYTYGWSPIQITSGEQPTFVTVDFSMTDGVAPATLGSKLIIDDLTTINWVMSAGSFKNSAFQIYPTLASQEINIVNAGNSTDGKKTLEIFSVDGKSVQKQTVELFSNNPSKIDIGTLSAGVYLVRIDDAVLKFVKK